MSNQNQEELNELEKNEAIEILEYHIELLNQQIEEASNNKKEFEHKAKTEQLRAKLEVLVIDKFSKRKNNLLKAIEIIAKAEAKKKKGNDTDDK